MTEELALEMAVENKKKKFFRTWPGILTILFVILVIMAALFSWWLANGRVSSVAANLDTVVYTVEPQFTTRLENVYVQQGDLVSAGQVLGKIDTSAYTPALGDASRDIGSMRQLGMAEIGGRLGSAQKAEKEMAARVAQARQQEEHLRGIWQERVTEHVRAQLAMRSLNNHSGASYQQAASAELAARKRMEAAKNDFEQYSRMRAAQDAELNRVRAELSRNRQKGNNDPTSALPPRPSYGADSDLYAPVAGRVLRINAERGQTVQQGEPLFLILPTDKNSRPDYWVQAWFPLSAKDSIKPGQKVYIHIEHNGMNIKGKVESISDVAPSPADSQEINVNALNHDGRYNPASYLPVRITLDNQEDARSLEPGIKADCQIQTHSVAGFDFFD